MQVREHGTGDAMDEAVFSGRESGAGKIDDSQARRRNGNAGAIAAIQVERVQSR